MDFEGALWPFRDPTAESRELQGGANAKDLEKLFDQIPDGPMRTTMLQAVEAKQRGNACILKEFYLAVGRPCELVFANTSDSSNDVLRSAAHSLCDMEHLANFRPLFDGLDSSIRRRGIDDTLHRISRTVHAITKETTAITARVGRTIQGTVLPMLEPEASMLEPYTVKQRGIPALAERLSKGCLLIGPPNVGKTTVLRELGRLLSLGNKRVVVIVDKSMEIGGTGVVPHHTIGNARVLTVETPSQQHRVMIEAVENQSPDFVIVDEISTKEECQAARTITGRGVALIASVHGESLAQLCNDPERSVLIGGVQSITLSAREAELRADRMRQVSRRYLTPVFGVAIELRGFADWVFHHDLERAVDSYLDYKPFVALWHVQTAALDEVRCTPLVACRPPGSVGGYSYAKIGKGEQLDAAALNFHEVDTAGGRLWQETAPHSNVYERRRPT